MNDYDEILFKKACKGDRDAFEQFIRNYEKLIYNAAYAMMPNPSDAQDISQEVLIKIYKNITKCKEGKAFKSWVFKIVHNTCIDEIRKRRGKYSVSLDAALETEDGSLERQLLKDENTPESELLKKIEGGEIQAAIAKLTYEYRSAITLRDINGFTYEEIANITGAPVGTVKSRIARARQSLKAEVMKIREQT